MSTTASPSETPSSGSGSARREGLGFRVEGLGFWVGTELDGGKELYRLERHLQKAIFGDVYEALALSTGRRLAVKVTELEKMRLQAKHQTLCESPLCEIRFAEMMKGLDNVLQLEEDQAKLLILDVARGLASLHMRGLAMQDVTLENMLLFVDEDGQWQVRVGDPGQAVAFVMDPATGQEKPVPFNGLVADDFRPPELYEEQDYLASRVDSWCLGWNTFYLLTAAASADK
ncbi:Stk33, partial [Symbiodinium natans]